MLTPQYTSVSFDNPINHDAHYKAPRVIPGAYILDRTGMILWLWLILLVGTEIEGRPAGKKGCRRGYRGLGYSSPDDCEKYAANYDQGEVEPPPGGRKESYEEPPEPKSKEDCSGGAAGNSFPILVNKMIGTN